MIALTEHQKPAKMENSSPLSASQFFIKMRFDDFDAFSELAQGWDLHFDQLDRGAFEGELWQCGVEGAQIARVRFNRKLEQRGAAPVGMRTFVIPSYEEIDLNWRRYDVGGDDLLVNPYNGDYHSVSNAGFDMFTISMTNELLEKAARACEVGGVLRRLQSCEVIRLTSGVSNYLRVACHTFFKRLRSNPDLFSQGRMDEALLVEFPRLIVQAIAESTGLQSSVPKLRERTRALRRARHAVEELAHIPITVARLCEISGMSERSLQYAFRDKFGISPKAYLQSYRLNRVRKKLRMADPASAMIADLANELGFWHMGQFAKQYRRQFGELPSVTLGKR